MLVLLGGLISLLLFALAVFLFIYFIVKKDRGRREPIGALFIAMGFGFLALILAGFLNEIFVPKEFSEIAKNSEIKMSWQQLMVSAMTVGVIEETVKCLPLALFIYKKKYFNELTDGIIYFGIAALTFGVIEDISYALMFGVGTGLVRIIFFPYLHVGFTILFGVALAYRKVLNKSWLLVVGGFLSAIIAHGLFDFFTSSGSLVGVLLVLLMTIFFNAMLFVLFKKTQKGDELLGQSAIGANKFCKNCGKPNPKQLLYCSYCGKVS